MASFTLGVTGGCHNRVRSSLAGLTMSDFDLLRNRNAMDPLPYVMGLSRGPLRKEWQWQLIKVTSVVTLILQFGRIVVRRRL